jgi:hypothetical protein
MPVNDLQSGGGSASALTENTGYPLAKIFDLQHPLTPEQVDLLNEALEILFRALTRGYNDIQSNLAAIAALQASLGSLSSTVSGLSTGGIPGIINQPYYVWYIGSGAGNFGFNTAAPIHNSTLGGTSVTWTHDALSSGIPMELFANSPALTGASMLYNGPANSTQSVPVRAADNPILDVFFGTGTPTGAGTNFRYWIGFFNSVTPITGGSDTAPTTDFVAARYSTTVPDSGWMAVTRDNTTTNPVSITGAAAYATDTPYHLRIRTNDKGSSWLISMTSINGTVLSETTLTSNLPRTAQDLYPWITVTKDATGAGQLVQIYLNRTIVRQGSPINLT